MALAVDSGAVSLAGTSGNPVSFPSFSTGGADRIVCVAVLINGGVTISSISGGGLTYNLRKRNTNGLNIIEYWTAVAAAQLTSVTIEMTLSAGAGFLSGVAFAISGAPASSFFDPDAALPLSHSTDELLISTDNANDIILGFYRSTTATMSAGTGFTIINAPTNAFFLAEYQIVSSTQTDLEVDIGTGEGTQNGGIADAIIAAEAGGGGIVKPAGPPGKLAGRGGGLAGR